MSNLLTRFGSLIFAASVLCVLAMSCKLSGGVEKNITQRGENLSYAEEGKRLSDSGKYEMALVALNSALEEDPMDLVSRMRRGLVYSALGKVGAAINDFSYIIELVPNDPGVRYLRGLALVEKGYYDYALKDFDYVVRGRPEHFGVHAAIADIYAKKVEYEKAVREYTSGLNKIQERIRNGGKAEQGKLVFYYEELRKFYFLRGEVHSRANELSDAFDDYAHAFGITEKDKMAQPEIGKGFYYYLTNENAEAVTLFIKGFQEVEREGTHSGYEKLYAISAGMEDFDGAVDGQTFGFQTPLQQEMMEESRRNEMNEDRPRLVQWFNWYAMGGKNKGKADRVLKQYIKRRTGDLPDSEWYLQVVAVMQGESTEGALLNYVSSLDDKFLCPTYFYLAQHKLLKGDMAGGVEMLERSIMSGSAEIYEYRGAVVQRDYLKMNNALGRN